MAETRIISTCLVQGSRADNSVSGNRIESNPWDLQLLLVDYIQKGLVLPKPTFQHDQAKLLGRRNVIDHLKFSLSKTLDLFPPLAGRLEAQKNEDSTATFFVHCNNLGAEFTHAIADGMTIADILDPTYIPNIVLSFFSLYKVPNCQGISKPLLAVRVTEMVDGLFIGCSMNHCVGDGTSFWNFMNAWSEICRGSDVITNPPVFGPWFPVDDARTRSPIRVPLRDEANILDKFNIPPPSLLTARVFHFTKENIAKLKSKANSEVGTKNNTISSFQALLAHLWRTNARHRGHHLGSDQEIFLFLQVGARDRLQPPLPKGYFGNAIYPLAVTSSATELLKNGLGWAAMQINKHVASQTSEEAKKWYVNWIKNPQIPNTSGAPRNAIFVSSSPRFNVYGNDFGWGKPVAVRSGVENRFEGKLTLFSGAEGGDIDIELCLPTDILDAMAKDSEFIEAATIQEPKMHA